jgi:cyclic pyranopterin phosphate synthase
MTHTVAQWQTQAAVKDRLMRPLRDLRISVIDRCNYRCPYCMPAELFGENHKFLPRGHWLTPGEIKRVASVFLQLGVKKLRLTGGEPLLRRDIVEIVAGLTELHGAEDLAITTNGSRLAEHAADLKKAGLKRITVSLDSIDEQVFREMNGGRGELDVVLKGIEAARAEGFPIKLNTVVERGKNDHTVLDLVERFRGTGIIVRFIEYMDVGTRNHWSRDRVVASRELLDRIGARWPLHSLQENYRGEVAERYAFDDGAGEVGFISSVTNPFCGSCTRARLSSEGVFYTCLFARSGVDLRAPLRDRASDDELRSLIANTWTRRGDRYSELRASLQTAEQPLRKIEMYYIGG